MNSIEFPEMNYKHFREKNAKFHIFLLLSIMSGISLITIYDRKFSRLWLNNRPEEGLPKIITYISPINPLWVLVTHFIVLLAPHCTPYLAEGWHHGDEISSFQRKHRKGDFSPLMNGPKQLAIPACSKKKNIHFSYSVHLISWTNHVFYTLFCELDALKLWTIGLSFSSLYHASWFTFWCVWF